MPPKLIDSHCHLEELINLDSAIEKAKSNGVVAIIAVGTDYQSNVQVLEIAEKNTMPVIRIPAV